MFDIYWNDDCICGGYETEKNACKVLSKIIEIHNLKFLAGGSDDLNSWGAYKEVDKNGFPNYHILSIKNREYKISKN